MNFKLKVNHLNNKKISLFEFNYNKKDYKLGFYGNNRRVKSFELLLKKYPEYLSIHDSLIVSLFDDPNKAVNEFIHDEGFNGFVLEKKIISKKNKKINAYKLNLDKICKHLDRDGIFGKQTRRQPTKFIQNQLIKRSNGKCAITGYKLFTDSKLKKNKFNFLSKMLTMVFDHRVPIFKGGSDDSKSINNWQIISYYVNNEKNKVCKNCYEQNCNDCALAYPEKSKKIKPTNQRLNKLNILN